MPGTSGGADRGVLSRLITRVVGWAVSVYFDVERRGPPLPPGPVLVVANHLNALVDPLVIFCTAGRPTRPLAKAPLFEHPLIGPALKALGGLPVFRPRDDPELVHRNESTFEAAIGALCRGEAVQIYPEGQSHSGPSLAPLKTGAARIALGAEERAGWELGLQIVPVGLVYREKHRFRGAAVAVMGEPLPVKEWRAAYEDDARAAARALTDAITRKLVAVTLNAPSTHDRTLLETVEAVYAREAGDVPERKRLPFGRRVDRLRTFARGLVWLRTNRPEEYSRLRRNVERYRRLQELLGSSEEAAVPATYRPGRVLAYVARQGSVLVALSLPALVAVVAWWLPYRISGLTVKLVEPRFDAISTFKLGVALLAFPPTLAGWALIAWWAGGWVWASILLVVLPVCGVVWIEWRERLASVAEDLVVFLRALPRRSLRSRLAQLRRRLVRDVEAIREEMAPAHHRERAGEESDG